MIILTQVKVAKQFVKSKVETDPFQGLFFKTAEEYFIITIWDDQLLFAGGSLIGSLAAALSLAIDQILLSGLKYMLMKKFFLYMLFVLAFAIVHLQHALRGMGKL